MPDFNQVDGTITKDGAVYCTCGKKCGQTRDGEVEFACQCGNRVSINVEVLYFRNCEAALAAINRGMMAAENIVNLMAAKRGQSLN